MYIQLKEVKVEDLEMLDVLKKAAEEKIAEESIMLT